MTDPSTTQQQWKEEPSMRREIHGLPTAISVGLASLMIGAWVYQISLAYQVARDFLAPGNPMLQIGFVLVIGALIGVIDLAVHRGLISVFRMNRYSIYAAGVAFMMLVSFFIVEIGRLNVVQNGSTIANELTGEYESTLKPVLSALDEEGAPAELKQKDVQAAELEKLVTAARSAVGLERAGGYRADIESTLRRNGIDFQFSRRRGSSAILRQLISIVEQKEHELSALVAERNELRGKEGDARTEAAEQVEQVRKKLVVMRTQPLTPETYGKFLETQYEVTQRVQELVQRRGITVDFAVPAVRSLFVVGVSSAFRFDATGMTLWLLAFATSFGPILFTLFLRAVIAHENGEQERPSAPTALAA